MTRLNALLRRRTPRLALIVALLVALTGGVIVGWPSPARLTVTGHFASAVGLYPGDDVEILGVPVGTVASISPGVDHTAVTFTVNPGVTVPADASAVIVAPNLLSARVIEIGPLYTDGPTLADHSTIPIERTAVPVEWDDVKDELTQLASQLGPHNGAVQGPLSAAIDQAADTFDGKGRSFRDAIRELSQTAGRLGDSRFDLVGTVKNLRTLVDALAGSNEQIVQFTGHVASLSQVFADSTDDLASSLDVLNTALASVKNFLQENNSVISGQVRKLTDFTSLLTEHSEDIEQVLHVAPNGLANFYNIYNPAQGSIGAILSLPNLANPVQFLCAGVFDAGGTPDYFKRTELCRQRMAPVLKRIMMNFPPVLFHPINSITAYKGQFVYDTPATEAKAQMPTSQLQWQPLPGSTLPGPSTPDLTSLILPPVNPGEPTSPTTEPGR
ncbi:MULTISPECIES: MCE family protein [Mycolicibacterium]|uniref:Virulence factor Mce family protein n=1 Tax=Mycolicibacterium neoaurum TaxID=1795 RepID=A0AAV2WF05_MYCNE|nr:MCE family protein [Mycolicibacterium neoaurum]TLH60812.1 MCE family protein [Mycolicibacterium neoaurum]CDQ42497.1 virulence factor Mce family protein [Mycolicibacterium neoaurum]